MTLHALPGCTELLAEAVGLARTAERLTRDGTDPASATLLRTLTDDLGTVVRVLEERLEPVAPRRGHLAVERDGGDVRLRGRGPAPDGDVVRSALETAAGLRGRSGEPSSARLWDALVALARDGHDPPTALPTPLGLVGRARPQRR